MSPANTTNTAPQTLLIKHAQRVYMYVNGTNINIKRLETQARKLVGVVSLEDGTVLFGSTSKAKRIFTKSLASLWARRRTSACIASLGTVSVVV